jgi:hypothetical protein
MRFRGFITAALAATLAITAVGAPPAQGLGEQDSPGARATVVRVSDPGGFDWAEAGIGAAGGVALSMLGVGLALLVSARSTSNDMNRRAPMRKKTGIMRLLKLFALLVALTAAPAAAAQADDFNLNVDLRPAAGGPDDGSGSVKFRQPGDPDKVVYLKVRVRDLAPNHSYYLQRATDSNVNDECTGTNWLTLGQGLAPATIDTDRKGNGRAELFRDLSAIPTGARFDIHFRVIDAVSSAVVLESDCYQFTVRG